MEEKYGQLLVLLASKLGTTAELLWAVLVKQAYISAWIQIGYTIFVCILGFVFYKMHIKFCKPPPGKDSNYTYYNYYQESLVIPVAICTLVYAIILFVVFIQVGDIFTKFMIPEYHALDKILTSIKQ